MGLGQKDRRVELEEWTGLGTGLHPMGGGWGGTWACGAGPRWRGECSLFNFSSPLLGPLPYSFGLIQPPTKKYILGKICFSVLIIFLKNSIKYSHELHKDISVN